MQLKLAEANATIKAQQKYLVDLKEIIQTFNPSVEIKNINQNHSGDGDNVAENKNIDNQ